MIYMIFVGTKIYNVLSSYHSKIQEKLNKKNDHTLKIFPLVFRGGDRTGNYEWMVMDGVCKIYERVYKNKILLIYNENLEAWNSTSLTQGSGNGFVRKFRADVKDDIDRPKISLDFYLDVFLGKPMFLLRERILKGMRDGKKLYLGLKNVI